LRITPMTVALDTNDTIAAVASPAGPAARGIVRLSGPSALAIAWDGFVLDEETVLPSRRAVSRAGKLRVDGLRPQLPVTMALWPAPRTYTGQNIAEIHLVGSAPLLNLVLAHCLARGARPAEPGEFTLRAFLSGRIDLTRAEAVLGVIDAQNPAQLEAALEQLAGGVSTPLVAMRDRLLDVLAHLEANLDFTEEPDVDPLGRAALVRDLDHFIAQLAALEGRLSDRDRPDAVPRVVLVGLPNVGKSRLFNAVLGKDQAIVSQETGTTRDYLTARCECDGLTIELVDTAGAEANSDGITALAQTFRARQAASADLLLCCRTAGIPDAPHGALSQRSPRVSVWTKGDRALPDRADSGEPGPLVTSAATGAGIGELRAAVARTLRGQVGEGIAPAGTSARCRDSFQRAIAAIRAASDTLCRGGGDELVAIDLRLAVDELGKVVGVQVTDDILDRIFRRFCIGK
jgi:tRNA modification GTPase